MQDALSLSIRSLVVALALAPSLASAQEQAQQPDVTPEATPAAAPIATGVPVEGEVAPMEQKLQRNEFMFTVHSRAAFAPQALLGLWFEEHSGTWSGDQRNLSYGAHFSWRRRGSYELGVLVDWVDLSMPSQFWRRNGESVEETNFTTLDLQMVSAVFTSYWYWNPLKWLSPYLGVGVGAGYLLGEGIVEYNAVKGTECDTERGEGEEFTPSACYQRGGEADRSQVDFESARPAERVPPVVPVLHVAGGLRFNIYEYGVIKLEVGAHNYTYVGLSLGGQWW